MAKALTPAQIGGLVAGIVIVALGGVFVSSTMLTPPSPPEVSVNVECEKIDATRKAVDEELESRKTNAQNQLDESLELASDHYYERLRAHDAVKDACMSNANLADPCKAAFENQSAVMEGAIADPTAERVAEWDAKIKVAKDAYNNCLENPPAENTTEGMRELCQKAFDAADQESKAARVAEEQAAQTAHQMAVQKAEDSRVSKQRALDALETACKRAVEEEKEIIGSLPGGGAGVSLPETETFPESAACTGTFAPGNPDLQKQLDDLLRQRATEESLLKQEQLGGDITEGGLGGAGSRSTKINELTQQITALQKEIAGGGRVCRTDADCGNPEPVCCSGFEVGKVKCEMGVLAGLFGGTGVCVNQTDFCEDNEVCSGKPAACVEVPTQKIEAIAYGGTYIPVSYLVRFTGDECDEAEHWHLAAGPAIGIDGKTYKDPDRPECGFGKTSEVPVVEVDVPISSTKIQVNMGGL